MAEGPLDAAEFSRRMVDCALRNGEVGITSVICDTFLASITSAAKVLVLTDAPNTIALGNALYARMVTTEQVSDPIP